MRTIRASDIGTYLYCQRAWWYQKRGEPSENMGEMMSGTELHAQHGRAVYTVGCMRVLAYGLLLAALVLLAIYFTNQLI
jgi:CRISPR/Cas system-associated exonuclease Cas4 (RecB family)